MTPQTHTSGGRRWLVAAIVGPLLAVTAGAPPATAAIRKADFPKASTARSVMEGAGKWRRGLDKPGAGPLGAKPAKCRSDKPFRKATESRDAYYGGRIKGTSKFGGQVVISVFRFGTTKDARKSIRNTRALVAACPTSVEWVCTSCDGVWDITRVPVSGRRVGAQSVAWKQRSLGLGASNGRAIAARQGRTVVVTRVAHVTDPPRLQYPAAPAWSQARKMSRKALNAAT